MFIQFEVVSPRRGILILGSMSELGAPCVWYPCLPEVSSSLAYSPAAKSSKFWIISDKLDFLVFECEYEAASLKPTGDWSCAYIGAVWIM